MAVAYRTSTTTGATSGTTISVPPPSGLSSGDMWVIFIISDTDVGDVTLPSGWTGVTTTFSTTYPRARAMWKTAGASEGNVTVTHGSGDGCAVISARFDGQDQTTPIDGTPGTSSTVTNSVVDAPDASVTNNDSMVVTWAKQNSGNSWTPPVAVPNEIADYQSGIFMSLAAAYIAANAGSLTIGNWTAAGSAAGTTAQTFVIKPAAAASNVPPIGAFASRTQTQGFGISINH